MPKLFEPWKPAGQWPAPKPAVSCESHNESGNRAAEAASSCIRGNTDSQADQSHDPTAALEFLTIAAQPVSLAESEATAGETEEEAGRRFLFDRIQRLRERAG